MKRIAALTLRQSDRLMYSSFLRGLYKDHGMWETYCFAPVVLLFGFDFDSEIDLGDGTLRFSSEYDEIEGFAALRCKKRIGSITPYLFLTKGKVKKEAQIPSFEVKVESLVLLEHDDKSFRVIRTRSLRMGK